MRSSDRKNTDMRAIKITADINKFAMGSALIELGDTKVHCTASVAFTVPRFLRHSNPAQGWLTAEYAMLPSATPTRTKRERPQVGGRSQEIQRLIGRSLRGVIDLHKCPDLTITVDCDVIQADGGTRTAAINGAYVALRMATDKLYRSGRIDSDPIHHKVAAISVGIKDGEYLCDLDYEEDSNIDLDMNVVMTDDGGILEVQGTAENRSFNKEQLAGIIDIAAASIRNIYQCQEQALANLRND
ncbi:MAG: ribonuclease PH [Pseudomonadota bacterium]|nr:ribonuclease PH [Pseudomonadota bacterium]